MADGPRSTTTSPTRRIPRRTRDDNVDQFIADALAMEAQSAKDAGALGFMARVLVQATLPHSAQTGNEYSRSNGTLTVSILAPSRIGLPYGSYPRLLLTWLTTEAVRTQTRELVLGQSLTAFMSELGLLSTGGRWGTVPRLKDQMLRLFSSMISAVEDRTDPATGLRHTDLQNLLVADKAELWWSPKDPGQAALWQSRVLLSEPFFKQIIDRPVPLDMRAIQLLKKSPLALDLYAWTTYRMSYLSKPTEIPWGVLLLQFGAGYPDTAKGRNNFKHKLLEAMRKVRVAYPALRAEEGDRGLRLLPSRTHIPKL